MSCQESAAATALAQSESISSGVTSSDTATRAVFLASGNDR
jgi:hypothetical protein